MRVIKIRVKPKEDRLDKYLSTSIKSLTRSQIKKLIKEKFIQVNDHQVTPDYKVKLGDRVKIQVPIPPPTKILPEPIPLKIIYEDDTILVIDKEAGMVSHPSEGHPSGTLVNAILHHLGSADASFGETIRPGIVHRLDRGTSGLMVIAKTQNSLENLKRQFKEHTVTKKYLVLVSRRLEPVVSQIDAPLARHPVKRQKFTTSPAGREAITKYRVLEHFDDKFTLVEAEPKTGRTHQLRVHFSSIGHPIVGDKLYGGKAAPRMFLHAACLEFVHPQTKKRMSFSSPLPSKLSEILDKIKKKDI